MHGVASSWSLLPHRVQRGGPSRTQSDDDTRITRKAAFLATGRPSEEDLRVPLQRPLQKPSESNTGTGTERLRSHRLSSRGAYLWETPNRGRFATLSDGGRLFLNLFSNDRVGRAAQRLGVRAAFWNLRYGERYDVTHRVNLRRLLRDIANGEVLGCMMSVPSTDWNVAHNCSRPLRSSTQPWGMENLRVTVSPSDLTCLDRCNCIMRSVIKLARQCQRFNLPWAIENPEKSLCWMTSQFQELSTMRNVHKMTFDFCAFCTKWRKRTTVLAGHVDSADVWALTMRCGGQFYW